MESTKKLYRSRSNRQICGVAGGLAEYLGIDPVLVRVVFVLATLAGGPGLIAYIILCFVMPDEPGEKAKRLEV